MIVACNTAAAAGLDELAAELPVPVFEVIEPGARALVQATRSGRVGVIGTVGTVSSGAYARAVEATGEDGRSSPPPPARASSSSSSGARPTASR